MNLETIPTSAQRSVPASGGSKYRADIDGLRAVAVLAVILYHFRLGLPGGFIGVDVFFVISGFLITGLIARHASHGASLSFIKTFWMRRIRRLGPAMLAVTAATVVGTYPFLADGDRVHTAVSAIAQLSLSSNIYFFQHMDYFGPDADSFMLLHFWSLSVEEQFYLIYPLPLLLLLKRGMRPTIFALAVIALTSFTLSLWCVGRAPAFNFYLLPTRAWELMLGGMLALGALPRPNSRRLAEATSWVGLTLVVLPMFLYSRQTQFPGLSALAPCVGTALMIHAHSGVGTSLSSVFSGRAIQLVGLTSYSSYLIHWPLAAACFYLYAGEAPTELRWGLAAASVVLGWVSWLVVETPVRKRMILASDRALLAAFLAGMLGIAGICAVSYQRNDTAEPGLVPAVTIPALRSSRLPRIGADTVQARDGRPDLLLWGDSHGQMLANELDRLMRERDQSGLVSVSHAQAPLLGVWVSTTGQTAEHLERSRLTLEIARSRRPRNVLLVGTWTPYVIGEKDRQGREGCLVDAETADAPEGRSAAVFERALLRTVKELQEAGARVWIFRSVPLQFGNVPQMLRRAEISGSDVTRLGVTVDAHRARHAVVDGIIDRVAVLTGASILDPLDHLALPNGHTCVELNGRATYLDIDHLHPEIGVGLLRPLLLKVLESNR